MNVYRLDVDVAGSFDPAQCRASQLGLLKEHHRLAVGDPHLDTAVALDHVGLAGHDVEELDSG
jgi:hypothetical protein